MFHFVDFGRLLIHCFWHYSKMYTSRIVSVAICVGSFSYLYWTKYVSQHCYVLHPEKSTILFLNSKTLLTVWREVQACKLKGAPVHVNTECTHLGLLRTTSKTNKALIDESLKLARRITYAYGSRLAWEEWYQQPSLHVRFFFT